MPGARDEGPSSFRGAGAPSVSHVAPGVAASATRGVDRPLTLPRHWRRNAGRLVKVTGVGGDVLEGRIVDCDDTSARLDVDGAITVIDYEQVGKAVVQVEFPKEAG